MVTHLRNFLTVCLASSLKQVRMAKKGVYYLT